MPPGCSPMCAEGCFAGCEARAIATSARLRRGLELFDQLDQKGAQWILGGEQTISDVLIALIVGEGLHSGDSDRAHVGTPLPGVREEDHDRH